MPQSLQVYSPAKVNEKYEMVTTVEQALAVKAKSIGAVMQEVGVDEAEMRKVLRLHILALDVYLKLKNGLSAEEVEDIVSEVMKTYKYILTFADLHVIFTNAREGRYGELYEKLTAPKVIGWIVEYERLRSRTAYEINLANDYERNTSRLADMGYILSECGDVLGIDKRQQEDFRGRDPRTQESRRADAGYEVWKAQARAQGLI